MVVVTQAFNESLQLAAAMQILEQAPRPTNKGDSSTCLGYN